MKKNSKYLKSILYWGGALCLSAPLLSSCAQGSAAEGAPAPAKSETMVASNTAAIANDSKGAKDVNKDADMKSVILNVFGMT